MTPRIAPTSPCPRMRQPGCSATLRPAFSITSGSQVSENAMSRDSTCSDRQLIVPGRRGLVEIDLAAVGVISGLNRRRRRDATCRYRQVRIRRDLVLTKVNVTNTMVVVFVIVRRVWLLGHRVLGLLVEAWVGCYCVNRLTATTGYCARYSDESL